MLNLLLLWERFDWKAKRDDGDGGDDDDDDRKSKVKKEIDWNEVHQIISHSFHPTAMERVESISISSSALVPRKVSDILLDHIAMWT